MAASPCIPVPACLQVWSPSRSAESFAFLCALGPVRCRARNRHAGSNRLMSLNYQSERLPEEVFEARRVGVRPPFSVCTLRHREAHRSWGRSLEQRLGQAGGRGPGDERKEHARCPRSCPVPDRREAFYRWNHAQKGAAAPLRVGYVSPDFYSHSAAVSGAAFGCC